MFWFNIFEKDDGLIAAEVFEKLPEEGGADTEDKPMGREELVPSSKSDISIFTKFTQI